MIAFGNTAGNAMLTDLRDLADAGSGPAQILIYSGPMPFVDGTLFTRNILLAELTCSDPCGSVENKTLTFGPIADDISVNAMGQATFFRLVDSDGAVLLEGTVSSQAGTGALQLVTVALAESENLCIQSAYINLSMPDELKGSLSAPVLLSANITGVNTTVGSLGADISVSAILGGSHTTTGSLSADISVSAILGGNYSTVETLGTMMSLGGFQNVATPVIENYEKSYFGAKTLDTSDTKLGDPVWTEDDPGDTLIAFESDDPATIWPYEFAIGPFYLNAPTHAISSSTKSVGLIPPQTIFQYDNLVKNQQGTFENSPLWQPADGAAIDGKFVVPAANVPLPTPLDGTPLIRSAIAANTLKPNKKMMLDGRAISTGEVMDATSITLNRTWYYSQVLEYHPTGFPKRIRSYSGRIFSSGSVSGSVDRRTGEMWMLTETFHFDELTPIYAREPQISTTWVSGTADDRWFDLRHIATSDDGSIIYVAGCSSNIALTNDYSAPNRAFVAAIGSTGTTLWTRTLTGNTTGARALSIQRIGDTLFVLVQFRNSISDIRNGFFEISATTGAITNSPAIIQNNLVTVGSAKVGSSYFTISDIYLIKHDQTGATLWARSVADLNTVWHSITPLGDGVVVSGTMYDATLDNYGAAVYRFDTSGNKVWGIAYGDPIYGGTPLVNRFLDDSSVHSLTGGVLVLERYVDERYDRLDGYYYYRHTATLLSADTGAVIWNRRIFGDWFTSYNYVSAFAATDSNIIIATDRHIVVLGASGDLLHVYEVNFRMDDDSSDVYPRSVSVSNGQITVDYFTKKTIVNQRSDTARVVIIPVDLVEPFLDFGGYTVVKVDSNLTSVAYTPAFGPVDHSLPPYNAVLSTTQPSVTATVTTYTENTPAIAATVELALSDLPALTSTPGNYWTFTVYQDKLLVAGQGSGLHIFKHRTACLDQVGNLYVLANVDHYSGDSFDRGLIWKISPTGTLLWMKEYSSAGASGTAGRPNCLSARVYNGFLYGMMSDGQVLRVNADTGDFVSAQRYLTGVDTTTAVMLNNGGTFYMGGYTTSAPRPFKLQIADPVAGTIGTRISFAETGSVTRTEFRQIELSGANLYVEGRIAYSGTTDQNITQRGLMVKLSAADLSIVWQKKYVTSDPALDFQSGGYISVDSLGNQYRLIGFRALNALGTSTVNPDLTRHFTLNKIDTDGNLVWSKVYRVNFPDGYANVHADADYYGTQGSKRIVYDNGKLYVCYSMIFLDTENITRNNSPGIMVVDAVTGEVEWAQNFLGYDGTYFGADGAVNLTMESGDAVLTVTESILGGVTHTMRLPVGTGKVIATQIGMEKHRFETGALVWISPTVTATDFDINFEVSNVVATPETATNTPVTAPISASANPAAEWLTYMSSLR